MERKFKKLNLRFPGRAAQLKTLFGIYGHKNEPIPGCVFIYGGPSTGKTTLLSNFLKVLNVRYALVNLIECYTSKILFETILNELSGRGVDPESGEAYAKCDNLMDFLHYLKKFDDENHQQKYIIVLDKAENLRLMDGNLLPVFLRFKEIAEINVSVILISEIPFQKFYTKLNIVDPIKLHFPQYNKQELIDILMLDREVNFELVGGKVIQEEDQEQFYSQYLNMFLSVFHRACKDVSELRYMAKVNFAKYYEPILKNECGASDSMKLWRNISPFFKSSMENLYLRISTNLDQENDSPNETEWIFKKENLARSLELPFYAKYLLIAAYLASYNPSKDDKRLFVKYHGKKKKTLRDIKAKSKLSEQLNTQLGPKVFSFDRLLAIFYAILDEKVGFNNNLLVQISSLVQLQLLSQQSETYNLDGQKYKCTVSFDFIQTVSKMVGFNIRKYLSDFSHM